MKNTNSNQVSEKVNQPSTQVSGNVTGNTAPNPETTVKKADEITPPADTQTTKNDGDEVPIVDTIVDGIDYPELKSQGQVIVKLDRLLVENEARNTIYELAFGIKANEIKATFENKGKKGKKLKDAFEGYFGNLKLSSARSTRTVQRYMQVVNKMTSDGTLTGAVRDALRAANFSDETKEQVLQLTKGGGITDLYVKYKMVGDKTSKVKGAKKSGAKKGAAEPEAPPKVDENQTLEQRLEHLMRTAIEDITKLLAMRDQMLAEGKVIDEDFQFMFKAVADAIYALSKHPLIAAKFVPVDDDET